LWLTLKGIDDPVKAACSKAVELVEDGFLIGLGSGMTVAEALKIVGERIRKERLDLTFIASSYQIEFLSRQLGLKLVTIDPDRFPNLALDGADQVEVGTLNMIKGGGAALAREKIIDSNSKKVAIIISEDKLVEKLGVGRAVPVEVLPFGVSSVISRIKRLEGRSSLREGQGKLGPTITDNGNMIIDVEFGPIEDPESLEEKIKRIPGVIEVGIFAGIADLVYVGKKDGSIEVLDHV